jgi:peptidoglycan hydrolase-like protein with peptidoglycan-binding domain
MREYINLVEGKERLDEVNKKDKQSIQKDVNTLKAGKTTYKNIERLFKKWDGQSSFFSAKSNHFMGMAAKKLGLPGLFAPEGRTFYKTTKDENSTRFATSMVPTGGMLKILGTGIKDEDLEKMATLNLLPDHRVAQFKKAKPELMKKAAAAPQTSDELDADSDDNKTTGRQDGPDSAKPKTEPGSKRGIKDGKITFSDGSTFYREESGKGLRLFQKKVGGMIRRMDELVRKMNESIPNSLKATLTESDKAYLMLEALTSSEAKELVDIVGDLELAIQAKDDQGVFISSTNIGLIKDRIAQYKPVIDKAKTQLTTADPDADKKDPDDKDDDPKKDDTKKDEKVASGDLAAFAKSGKGGLANDPEEVEAIKELQQYLSDMGFDPNGVDGKYGPGTKKAVKEFQSYFGAKPDGDAGPETIGQIIKLRSIMFKGGKNFADFRKDMTRMEELLKKAGSKSESKDMDSIRSILETLRRLDEALTDQEKKELDDLIAQYDSIMNDAEFATAIPKPSYDRYKKIIDAAKALDGGGDLTDKLDGKDGEVDKSDDTSKATLDPDRAEELMRRMRNVMGNHTTGWMTDELAVQDILKQLKNKADWELLSKAYYDFQVGKTKHRYRTGDLKKDLQGVMSEKYYAQYVASELTRIGVNPGEGTGTDDKDSGDVTGNGEVDKGAGKFTVVPRKGGQGNNRMFGYDVKDANGNTVAKFGKQEKAAAEAEAARLNGGSSTTSSNEPVKKADDGSTDANKIPAEKRIADFKTVLSDPNIDLDTIIKVAKEMKADTEVWNMATPGLRKQLDQVIATGGK